VAATTQRADWRRRLRRGIGWALVVKLIALIVLWAFFFSPAHRPDVTAESVGAQLVVEPEESSD
jgi:hypothetical protein